VVGTSVLLAAVFEASKALDSSVFAIEWFALTELSAHAEAAGTLVATLETWGVTSAVSVTWCVVDATGLANVSAVAKAETAKGACAFTGVSEEATSAADGNTSALVTSSSRLMDAGFTAGATLKAIDSVAIALPDAGASTKLEPSTLVEPSGTVNVSTMAEGGVLDGAPSTGRSLDEGGDASMRQVGGRRAAARGAKGGGGEL
jgi:hypothetical protein